MAIHLRAVGVAIAPVFVVVMVQGDFQALPGGEALGQIELVSEVIEELNPLQLELAMPQIEPLEGLQRQRRIPEPPQRPQKIGGRGQPR